MVIKLSKVLVKELIEQFNFKIIHNGDIQNNYLTGLSLMRFGLLLIHVKNRKFFLNDKYKNIVYCGSFENKYLMSLSYEQLKKIANKVNDFQPTFILFNSSFTLQQCKQIAKTFKNTNITIAHTNMRTQNIYLEVIPWIARKLAPISQLHAALLSIFGVGVLIYGKSGVGKSETVMELIKLGHLLVGDDAIDVYNFGSSLFGKPSKTARHFVELRGLGILNIEKMYGRQTTLDYSEINMVVNLVYVDKNLTNLNKFKRINDVIYYKSIRGVKVPTYDIPIIAGRQLSTLIESAVINFKSKINNYDASKDFWQNYNNVVKIKNKHD